MIENGKNEVYKDDPLLRAIADLLNISVPLVFGVLVWSIFSIIENSTAIAKIMNGSFLP